MTNPAVHAFFVGRAVAQGISEQLEKAATEALSEFGKFDAEQRERLRQFSEQVMERANQEAASSTPAPAPTTPGSTATGVTANPTDLQEVIDTLRAEIAELRTKLQQYRDQNS